RLRLVAEVGERANREVGVADPAVAVVPVAFAAWRLRQRGRRRGNDGTGGRVGEGLEGDGRPHRAKAGGCRRVVFPDPPLPPTDCVVEAFVDLLRRRWVR